MAERLLDVKDLSTQFFTHAGIVKAVNGVSFTLDRNETIGIVGESGSGKTVAALSLMRLIPDPPGNWKTSNSRPACRSAPQPIQGPQTPGCSRAPGCPSCSEKKTRRSHRSSRLAQRWHRAGP